MCARCCAVVSRACRRAGVRAFDRVTALCAVKIARWSPASTRDAASKQLAVEPAASLLYALGAVPLITLNNAVQMPAVAAAPRSKRPPSVFQATASSVLDLSTGYDAATSPSPSPRRSRWAARHLDTARVGIALTAPSSPTRAAPPPPPRAADAARVRARRARHLDGGDAGCGTPNSSSDRSTCAADSLGGGRATCASVNVVLDRPADVDAVPPMKRLKNCAQLPGDPEPVGARSSRLRAKRRRSRSRVSNFVTEHREPREADASRRCPPSTRSSSTPEWAPTPRAASPRRGARHRPAGVLAARRQHARADRGDLVGRSARRSKKRDRWLCA